LHETKRRLSSVPILALLERLLCTSVQSSTGGPHRRPSLPWIASCPTPSIRTNLPTRRWSSSWQYLVETTGTSGTAMAGGDLSSVFLTALGLQGGCNARSGRRFIMTATCQSASSSGYVRVHQPQFRQSPRDNEPSSHHRAPVSLSMLNKPSRSPCACVEIRGHDDSS
jgi:hypothetical protein